MDFNFRKEMDWTVQETEVNKERIIKIKENPSTGLFCYKRFFKGSYGQMNYCYEVVQPVGKNRQYPSPTQFGSYGMCISKNDRYLDEKIDYYLSNGFSVPFSQRNQKNPK